MHRWQAMLKIFNELKSDLFCPIPWVSWALGTTMCAITGPFGTYTADPLWFRFVFWGGILLVATVYSLTCLRTMRNMRPQWNFFMVLAVSGPIFISTYSAFVILLIRKIYPIAALPPSWLIFAIVTCVTIGIQFMMYYFDARNHPERTTLPVPNLSLTKDTGNPLLSRITPEMGTKLIRLHMRDHYVEAYTCRGMQLIHMRFSDAVAALSQFNGLQVHRSHWVNLDEVCEAIRKDGKACFYMSDNAEVPVSRGKIKQLKEMGILS